MSDRYYKKILWSIIVFFCLPFFAFAVNEVSITQNTNFTLNTLDTASGTTVIATSGGQVTYIDARANYIDVTLDSASSVTFTTGTGGQYLKITKQSGANTYTLSPTCPTTSAVLTGTGAPVIVRLQVQTTNPCSPTVPVTDGTSYGSAIVIPPVTVGVNPMPVSTSTATTTIQATSTIVTTTVPQATATPVTVPPSTIIPVGQNFNATFFKNNLTVGAKTESVRTLQAFLNAQGFIVAKTGPGSIGYETSYFGALTRSALAQFQAAHGIHPAVGYFGPITRAFLNTQMR